MNTHPMKVVAGSIFLAVVVGLSLFTATDFFNQPVDYQKLFMILLGLAGVILYLTKVRAYSIFLWAWILLQIIKVEKIVGDQVRPLVDLNMSVNYSYPVNFDFQGMEFILSLNILPLIFVPFMFTMSRTNIVGQVFTLKQFRSNESVGDNVPQVVKALDIINFAGNKDWVLVHLSKGIIYGETKYFHALVKAKDYISIRKGRDKQIVHFRLFDGHKKPEKGLKDFPFIDWMVLE